MHDGTAPKTNGMAAQTLCLLGSRRFVLEHILDEESSSFRTLWLWECGYYLLDTAGAVPVNLNSELSSSKEHNQCSSETRVRLQTYQNTFLLRP